MPLKPGKSKKVIQQNIKEGAKSAKEKGSFGNQKGSLKKLMPSIEAAAYQKAGKSKKGPKGGQ